MKSKNIFTILFASVAIGFEAFLGIFSVISFFIQVILIAILVSAILSFFKSGKTISFFDRVKRLSILTAAFVGFFLSIFLTFVAYHNIFPGKLSDITISNGKQTVVFLQMSHIATPEFYAEKNRKIQELSIEGHTLLMEGVKPGTPENQENFSASLGFNFTPTLYSTVSSFIGLDAQDNDMLFSGASTGSVVSVDISFDDIMAIMGTGSIPEGKGAIAPVDIEGDILALDTISQGERIFVGYVARSLMNLSLKHMSTIEDMMMLGSNPDLAEAILYKRNDAIVNYILTHPDKNITVVYGGLHFEGVFSALQEKDPHWKIINIISYTPYNP